MTGRFLARRIHIPDEPGELWSKIKKVFRYFFLEGDYLVRIIRHAEIVSLLKPYRSRNLIGFRAKFIYILPYVSKSLNIHQKHQILINHYSFLDSFNQLQLKRLFTTGIEYYETIFEGGRYSIYLQAVTSHLEFEGSLSLTFKLNDITLYCLGFTVVPGEVFGYNDEQLLFISASQGSKKRYGHIRKATKHFNGNSLPTILLTALQAIATDFNILKCIGVSVKNQLSYSNDLSYDKFYTTYDAFWMNAGGDLLNGDYLIGFPIKQKPLHLIKQTHRNRTIKKRKKLEEIYQSVLINQRLLVG